MPDPHLSGDEPIGTDFPLSAEPSMRPHDAETGEELERSELVRGYKFSKGRYVMLMEDELAAIDLELSRTLELAKLVDLVRWTSFYLDTSYYVAPDGTISDETQRRRKERQCVTRG